MTETSNEVSGVNETNPDGVRITAPTNAAAVQTAGSTRDTPPARERRPDGPR